MVITVRIELDAAQVSAIKRYAAETGSGLSVREEVRAAAENGVQAMLEVAGS